MILKLKKCLHLSKFFPPEVGGIETVVKDLSAGLARRGWAVEVICANVVRRTVVEFQETPVTRLATWFKFAKTSITPSLIRELKTRDADIIHIHLPNPFVNIAVFVARPNCKVVLHWHSDIVQQRYLKKIYAPLQEWLLKRADAIVATSPLYVQGSPCLRPYRQKVHIVPLGSQLRDSFDASGDTLGHRAEKIRSEYGRKKIIFALGRFVKYKSFDVLIDAAQHLDDDAVVLIGGDGELKESLVGRVVRLGLEEKVIFVGRIADDHLPAYYQACDVFCLPSTMRSEAFGLVLVEAMSYGRPVVATEIEGSGVPWVNQNGITGFNVAPGDPVALATALRRILSDRELGARFGEAGKVRFEKMFSVARMIDGVEAVYEELLGRGQNEEGYRL
jgi:glycosyltransferase involved in cell wall biosynthesis